MTAPGSLPAPGTAPADGSAAVDGSRFLTGPDAGRPLAVVVARDGRIPPGADEAVAEAGGAVVVTGSGTRRAAAELTAARRAWTCETGPAFRPGALARALAPALAGVPLVVLPASADGRDLAPRLAAALDRPLLARCVRVRCTGEGPAPGIRAEPVRLDDRVVLPVTTTGPAVATLVPGSRSVVAVPVPAVPVGVDLSLPGTGAVADAELVEVLDPLPQTVDLAEAPRVVGAGAGLVPAGTPDGTARALLDLLARVGARLGASMGATRVVTDAGWTGHERQIGTTGVAVGPELYIALGISGASQHTGGLGSPRHVVSVNTDPSCPMTAMADLGLVTDARELLVELARRLGEPVPEEAARA